MAFLGARREGLKTDGDVRVICIDESKGHKLGNIPATITSANTCPPSCGLYGKGCYAEYHMMKYHWKRAPRDGRDWDGFLRWVRALPEGQVWRHNLAGDLPGIGEVLTLADASRLVLANSGRRGFTFTHKSLADETTREFIKTSNLLGFTINLSADSLEEADAKAALDIGPVAVVLPHNAPNSLFTPQGRRVVVCPAQTHQDMTCSKCQLCTRTQRSVVGFRAHGQAKSVITKLVQLRGKLGASVEETVRQEAINAALDPQLKLNFLDDEAAQDIGHSPHE
jgi:hypothetical protein